LPDPDPHYFGKLELDPYPYYSEKSGSQSAFKSKIQELWRLKMPPRRAMNVHMNGGVEAQNGAMEDLQTNGSRLASLVRSRNRIRIRIKMKSRIQLRTLTVRSWSRMRTRIKVMRIHNPG
jgi:hypothetical protein